MTLSDLNLGGGYGVRYTEEDEAIDIPARLAELAAHLKEETERLGLPMPRFLMEPGRSIVADAGMTLYTVGSVKRIPGYKQYAAVDGGMTDNPRYALYQSRYTVYHAHKSGSDGAVRCGGPLLRERGHHPARRGAAGRHLPGGSSGGVHHRRLQLLHGLQL